MAIAYVTCPRCHLRMSVTLHQIMSTDEEACPRCQASDGVTIPMLLMPETDGDAERRVSPSPGRGTA